MENKEEILGWLSSGNNESSNIIDLKWVVTEEEGHMKLVNEKVPFTLFIGFHPGTMHVKVKTGIETAVIDQNVRLATYHSLLILNSQAELVKFMLEGTNEEIVARSDIQTQSLTKAELNESFNKLLSALYMMVKALKLEEQFNRQITERMIMMIQGMVQDGKSRDEIRGYLMKEIGLKGDEADRFLGEVMPDDRSSEGMYR
jgi:ketopantoate reductase